MKRHAGLRLALVILVVILLAGVASLVVLGRIQDGGKIYSVSQVKAGLRQHPREWLGRTIRLRASISWETMTCPGNGCAPSFYLADYQPIAPLRIMAQPISATTVLLLHPEQDALLSSLRQAPVIGRLLPGAQELPIGGSTVRVRLEQAPTSALCSRQPCYEAILPDAGPLPQMARPRGLGM